MFGGGFIPALIVSVYATESHGIAVFSRSLHAWVRVIYILYWCRNSVLSISVYFYPLISVRSARTSRVYHIVDSPPLARNRGIKRSYALNNIIIGYRFVRLSRTRLTRAAYNIVPHIPARTINTDRENNGREHPDLASQSVVATTSRHLRKLSEFRLREHQFRAALARLLPVRKYRTLCTSNV